MVYHLGHYFLDSMRQRDPNEICQIDAGTGDKETYGSVLSRSIRLARSFKKMGLRPGDVLALGGRNTINIRIPYYAAVLYGLPIAGVDPAYKYQEIKTLFKIAKPKIAFCQKYNYEDYTRVASELGLDVKVVLLDGEEHTTIQQLIDEDTEPIEGFEPEPFDTNTVYAWLVSTSGTTGVPKLAAFRHTDLVELMHFFKSIAIIKSEKNICLILSPVQWITAYFNVLTCPAVGVCILQSSRHDDLDHVIDIINQYLQVCISGPSVMTLLLKSKKPCDLTCFDTIGVGGAKVYKDVMLELRARSKPGADVMETYGSTETIGSVLLSRPEDPPGCTGVPLPIFDVKLVDPETNAEITEANVPGELWTQGPSFVEYYKNPEETKKAFKDGWYRTGDLLYRDETGKYYYVDRLKLLIKYRGHHISPIELEEIINSIDGVKEVGVTSVPDPVDNEHPVACVVRSPGSHVTEQEIKDVVISKLSATKQLRGGVVFVDELPKTSTGKVLRARLSEIARIRNVPLNASCL